MSSQTLAPSGGAPAHTAQARGRVLPFPITGQEIVLIAVIAVLWVALTIGTPAFLTEGSIVPLLVAMAPVALIGIGMTVIIITGGIDVSVASIVMVCSVVVAQQLVERPKVLVLAEPTQGVDVGAKEEIHKIVRSLAEEGTAVLIVTSDLPEAIRISDRLQVVRAGTTTVEFGPGASQADVLAAAAGAIEQEAA